MKLIIEVTEGYYKHLKDKKYNRKATVSDATILDGIPYEERPQGEWIYDYINGFGNKIGHCSECKYSCEHVNYCPHCGADMRGAENETTN